MILNCSTLLKFKQKNPKKDQTEIIHENNINPTNAKNDKDSKKNGTTILQHIFVPLKTTPPNQRARN
jgi:hypothetical protein